MEISEEDYILVKHLYALVRSTEYDTTTLRSILFILAVAFEDGDMIQKLSRR